MERATNAQEFRQITEQFLRFHKATRVRARFEDGNLVCSIMEFDLTTPSGGDMSCLVTELATIKDGKLSEVGTSLSLARGTRANGAGRRVSARIFGSNCPSRRGPFVVDASGGMCPPFP